MDKEILELIENSKKDYNKIQQRAELIKINKKFISELRSIKKILGGNFFKFLKFINSFALGNFDNNIPQNENYSDKLAIWQKFCDRWHIESIWEGQFDSLDEKIKREPLFYIEHEEECIGEPPPLEKIVLIIDAWTTQKDINKIWPRIEDLRKRLFLFNVQKKSNFGRNLCWYILNKKYKKKYKEIAELWCKYCPDQIDNLVVNQIKNDNDFMEMIRNYIFENNFRDLMGRNLNDADLLREIINGRLKKFEPEFKEKRNYYIKKTHQGKNPFIKMIKIAIKRMQKDIFSAELRIGSDDVDYLLALSSETEHIE